MTQPPQFRITLALLVGGMAIAIAACESNFAKRSSSPPAAVDSITSAAPQPVMAASPRSNAASIDPYKQAIARASSAFTLSQSAQSSDDWRLVAGRWQQAIQTMTSVSGSSPNRAIAQKKLAEYRRNLSYAQQQANQSTPVNSGSVIVLPQQTTAPVPSARTAPVAALPQRQLATTLPTPTTGQSRSFSVPIVRRAGNTPVVNVTFNGSQTFEMIVDTGASGTLITQSMANALGLVAVAQVNVDTASQQNVTLPLGYVNSIEVGGVIAQQVLVAVAGSQLSIGLLGHDFFGHYDVTIRESEVEFKER